MVITSENNNSLSEYRSAHFRYAVIYVLITSIVLIILNIYSSNISQTLFFNSKKASMIEKCNITAKEISGLEVLNASTIEKTVPATGGTADNRIVVTDSEGIVIFDSASEDNLHSQACPFPEAARALEKNDVFSSNYHDGVMRSQAAVPIFSYGALVGCVYMSEVEADQGALIQSLQHNILMITLVLEVVVILYSLIFTKTFSKRLRKILSSMRIIRGGDYTHEVNMGGNDELTVLGNEFDELVKRLRTSEQKRSNFVSDASHELKTPLASIKLLSDSILQNDMDMETVREFVGDIGNEADRLNRMSQKLLSLSRIETQADSDCEIVTIAPTIEKVCRMLSTLAKDNQVTIAFQNQQDGTILILEDDLYQIIFNLVENGIKYNRRGGTLTITLFCQDGNAMIRFTDTGMGIPQDALDHIFERFYRVDKARSRKTGGSGLGLAIVRNLVERNTGTIHVESTAGSGSVFLVSFPIFDTEES